MADHDGNPRCLAEINVPIAFILPSRWQDGAESPGMETTSFLANRLLYQTLRSFVCLYMELHGLYLMRRKYCARSPPPLSVPALSIVVN